MKKSIYKWILVASVFLAGFVQAAEQGEKSLWNTSAEIGYVSTSGNTETETLNMKGTATTDREKWKHKFELTSLTSSVSSVTTAEKYLLSAQSNYKLIAPNYLFGLVTYEDDTFNANDYDYQVSEAIGYGRRVIDDKNLSLDLEIGPGARQSKLPSGETESESLIRAAAKLEWTISKTSKFSEELTVDSGEDSDVIRSVSALTTSVKGNLSMKVTYTYKNTSDVPVNTEETDTETAITLVYTF